MFSHSSYKYQFCKQKILEYAISIYPERFQIVRERSYRKFKEGTASRRERDRLQKYLDLNIPKEFHYQILDPRRYTQALSELWDAEAINKVGKGRNNIYIYNSEYKYKPEVFSMENFPDLIIYSPIK